MAGISIDVWLNRINNLTARQVAYVLTVVGIVVFFTGLGNPFQNDDTFQVVNNPPVHSIANVMQFFQAGTYWNGQQLTGSYYRPLMTTAFSLIYTLFGPQPWAFHVIQLGLYIASAFLVYLVLKHFLMSAIALPLTLIFLVHPINSQIVYSIAAMQDVLFFFFGLLAIWLLIRYESATSLWTAAVCLLLSLLSKETGVVFAIMALLYLLWFNRQRVLTFIGVMVVPFAAWLALKIHAVGLIHTQTAAPIDNLNLASRLLTIPSIVEFYITKLVFPWQLATTYYWTYPKFSVAHTLLPLLIDLVVVGLFAYLGLIVHNRSKPLFRTYCFFAIWTTLGLGVYLQLVPLDMTACENWLYFALVGLFGMIGLALLTVRIRWQPLWLVLPVVALVALLGFRSATRGTDYRSQYILAQHDVAASSGDYTAMISVSQHLIDQRNYKDAAAYAQQSIDVYPSVSNYNVLGVALEEAGDYTGAIRAYSRALQYNNLSTIYENLGLVLIAHADASTTHQFFQKALTLYPNDYKLWLYLAIFDGSTDNTATAKLDIQKAAQFGSVPPAIYGNIMNDQPFVLPLLGKQVIVR